ncbi:MAG: DEAD/DEAH box helicase [Candidatus Thorarchaeota archaeon]
MELVRRSGILIPRKYKNNDGYVKIKELLARRSKAYNRSDYTYNIFYLESEKFLLIPRFFPIEKYFGNFQIHDHRHEGKKININHNITPRSKTQEKAIAHLMNNENAILQLEPGVGKTVITIYMIAERKRKSFILVHRDPLAKQWRKRLLNFTDIKAEDISRLSSATFKEDLDKPIIISTTQTFISLLKRKRREFLINLNEANIGIFIGDEVHTSVGAPTFSECSIHMPCKYTYGLSATPYRYDGNEDIIKYHLGEIFKDDDETGTMKAKVTVILLDFKIDIPFRYQYIHWGDEFQRSRYLNMLRRSKPLERVVRGLLMRLKDERDLILISERINYIDELYKWIKSSSKAKFCGSGGLEALKSKVTFATPGKCRDGIDAPWKDCLIMTSPISNIKQLTGRIVRTKEGKKIPIIIDLVDHGCEHIKKTFYARNQFYKDKGWEIQYLLFVNNKLVALDEFVTFQILGGN